MTAVNGLASAVAGVNTDNPQAVTVAHLTAFTDVLNAPGQTCDMADVRSGGASGEPPLTAPDCKR